MGGAVTSTTDSKTTTTIDSQRFGRAAARAAQWHATQKRKGSETPYLSHLLGVASLVLEDGGDEDQAIAALLHDAAEDAGGERILTLITQEFGERVASIVRACSDSLTEDAEVKAPWRERKEDAIVHLRESPDEVLVVAAADKLHNLRTTVVDHAAIGDEVWERFKTGREGFLWYHEQLHELFAERIPASRSVAAMAEGLEVLRSG